MNPATASLLALLVVIGVSLTSRINLGVLAIALAGGLALLGAAGRPDAVLALFPSSLFLTLAGVTLLFGIAQENGTLQRVAARAVAAWGGGSGRLPLLFFVLAAMLAAAGPGAIAATALLAPLALRAGVTAGVRPFLMALMVSNGANAGNLSPFSAVGVIVEAQMLKAGITGAGWAVFLANFTAHAAVAGAAALLFRGPAVRPAAASPSDDTVAPNTVERFTRVHGITLAVLGVWITAVVALRAPLGLSAFAAAAALILGGAIEDGRALRSIPWSVLLTVSGVSLLVAVLEKSGGMDLMTDLLARLATPGLANGVLAFVTGLISTYSSTSGVVYPAFLPTVGALAAKLGGGSPAELALSINVGAALVDVSPLSTIGALCLAALPAGEDSRRLFRQLLLWGFAMVPVGAVLCQVFSGAFAALIPG